MIIAISIMATGIYAYNKLGYWHRSTAIFGSAKGERSGNGRERFERHGYGGMHGNGTGFRSRIPADSLRTNTENGEAFKRHAMRFQGQGHAAAYGNKRINLRSVIWFLPVFAGFSTIAICFDKWYSFYRREKAKKTRA